MPKFSDLPIGSTFKNGSQKGKKDAGYAVRWWNNVSQTWEDSFEYFPISCPPRILCGDLQMIVTEHMAPSWEYWN